MDCNDTRDLLDSLVDGELSAAQLEEISRRLQECKDVRNCHRCRKALEDLRRLKEIVSTAPARIKVPPRLVEGLRAQLLGE